MAVNVLRKSQTLEKSKSLLRLKSNLMEGKDLLGIIFKMFLGIWKFGNARI